MSWSRRADEEKLDKELRFHFDQVVQEHLDAGMEPSEARRRARQEFGRLEQVKDECRDQRPLGWTHDLANDLRYGARSLLQAPLLLTAALVSLALGIGANTAVFAVVKSLLLNPLPYDEPERIVSVMEEDTKRGGKTWTTPAGFADWREQNRSFDAIAAVQWSWPANIVGGGEPARIGGQRVTSQFFEALSASAAMGRTFTAEDCDPEASRTVVISHALWQGFFGGDAAIIGREIKLDNDPTTVIGVMGPDFRALHRDVEFWAPFATEFEEALNGDMRSFRWLYVIARLAPSVSIEQGQADMDVIGDRIAKAYPADQKDRGILLHPLHETLVGEDQRRSLWVLLGAVGFVLLAACVNVANLLLGRGAVRRREIAVRMALGAGRERVVRQLLAESVLLGVAGAAAGCAVAYAGLRAAGPLMPPDFLPPGGEFAMDAGVLAFTAFVGIATTLVFGLTPALQATSLRMAAVVGSGGRSTGDRGRTGLRQSLVVVQTALALVVLAGAGLMLNTLLRINSVDFGGDPKNLVMMQTLLPRFQYSENVVIEGIERNMRAIKPEHSAFHRSIVARLENTPGIEAAGVTDIMPVIPLGSWSRGRGVGTANQPFDPNAESQPQAAYRPVSQDYFEAMGLGLQRGRRFDSRDAPESDPVAIVNETMAGIHWPDQDPIGQFLTFHNYVDRMEEPRRVIGVVEDVRQWIWDEPYPEVYVPYLQQTPEYPGFRWEERQRVSFVIRSPMRRADVVRAVRTAVSEFDPELPLYDILSMDEVQHGHSAPTRVFVWLLGGFAAIALILAVGGAYSVMSYLVELRHREIGLRMALGAERGKVLSLVIRQGLRLTAVGAVAGLAASTGLARFFENMLFEVEPGDPLTLGAAGLLVVAAALAANYLPARRATKIEPMAALRHD